jgi:hypothetical protein
LKVLESTNVYCILQLEENTGKKSKVLESTAGHQMRGFTATQLPDRERSAKTGNLTIVS